MRELMLVEEFKNCVPERTVVYLNEQKVTTLQQAATLADEFVLTHRNVFPRRDSLHCDFHQKVSDTQPVVGNVSRLSSTERPCFYCRKPGHLIADCSAWKRKQQGSGSVPKPPKGVGLIKTVTPNNESMALKAPDDCFKPFIFDGFVSLTGKAEDQRLIKVLRDTGGSQFFVLAGVLPFGPKSACEASTVVSGIEMGFVPAPLHCVHVQSNLITGFFPVAVLPRFPIDGISFIMGNDIAGGKVHPALEVVEVPITSCEHDELTEKYPDIFAVSILSRA